MMNNEITRKVSIIPGMEDYDDYFVTSSGDVYSTKWNRTHKLKPSWAGEKKDGYSVVKLSNKNGKIKTCYVHRLIAGAFLPNHSNSWGIIHKDGNLKNNALSNLEWIGKRISKDSKELDTDRIFLSKDLSDYIKLVHYSAMVKGIPIPPEIEFFNGMINESLEAFVNRYGLRKTIYQIQNSTSS